MDIQLINEDCDYDETLEMYEYSEQRYNFNHFDDIYNDYDDENGWYLNKCFDGVFRDDLNGECLLVIDVNTNT